MRGYTSQPVRAVWVEMENALCYVLNCLWSQPVRAVWVEIAPYMDTELGQMSHSL